jgi:hypothetical protein
LSSPFLEQSSLVALHVTTGHPLAEVFLIDREFVLVDRSIGELDKAVTPGVYTVKVRLGDATAERLIVANEDTSLDMSSELTFASAAPISGTSRTHEYHMDVARSESLRATQSAGSGSEVFLMTRSWSARDLRSVHPPSDMLLRRPDGTTVAELHNLGTESGRDPARGATIEVNPGAYLLDWHDDDAVIDVEQALYAVPGWQTQVFLLGEPDEDRGINYRVSMLMTKSGFQPEDRGARTVEVARSALAGERKVASSTISDSLFAKFDNPMLGLFGAHLMLLAHEAELNAVAEQRRNRSKKHPLPPVQFRQEQFDHVVQHLAGLLGPDHPDVVALTTKTSNPRLTALAPVTMPPLLWRSWLLLIEGSHDHPPLVPADTWRRARRPLPLRPFLIWAVSGEEDQDVEDEWRREVRRVLGGARARGEEGAEKEGADWTDRPADMELRFPSADDEIRQLSRQLLAPRAVIDELAAN